MAFFQRTVAVSPTNLGSANGPFIQMWWRFLRDMIDAGWRVKGSGDTFSFLNEGQTGATGTGYGGGYNVISSDAGGEHNGGGGSDTRVVGGLGNIWGFPYTSGIAGASWIRIATPIDAEHYREYMFQSQWKTSPTSTRHVLVVYMTIDATAFASGATAYDLPLPTDISRYACIGGWQNPKSTGTGQNQTPTPITMTPGGSGGYCHWFIGDRTSDYDFSWWSTRTSEQSIFRLFGQYRLQNCFADQIDDEDLDPYVIINAGGTTDSNSADVVRSLNTIVRVSVHALEPRLGDRVFQAEQVQEGGVDGGVYASWGYWRSGTRSNAGFYSVAISMNYVDANPLAAVDGIGRADAFGTSLLIFNPVVIRGGGTGTSTDVRFYKGRIKNDLIALTTRFDDPAVLEDRTSGGVGRRLSTGYLSLRWIDGQPYLE